MEKGITGSVLVGQDWRRVYDPRLWAHDHWGWSGQGTVGGTHLAQVVEIVLVMDPAVIGSHAVGAVGDISGIHAQTVVELALEELRVRDTG